MAPHCTARSGRDDHRSKATSGLRCHPWRRCGSADRPAGRNEPPRDDEILCWRGSHHRSEEHTSELQSLMRTSYAVFCLKKKKQINTNTKTTTTNEHMNINYH